MDLSYGGNGSGEEIYNAQKGRKQYHRHSTQQIQRLEAFYKDFPHPDKKQRQRLGSELGLEPKQIKFWFQNKRTQIKAQNEKSDNNSLRAENERILFENLAMQEALKNRICPSCNGSCLGEDEKQYNLLQLRMENARLKKELEQAMILFSNLAFPSFPPPGAVPLANMPGNHFPGEGMGPTTLNLEQVPQYPENNVAPHWPSRIMEKDISSILVAAIGAINELMNLINANEPVWVPEGGRYTVHRDSYDKLYPHLNHIKTANARFESSRHSGEVEMAAIRLVEILLDADKWKDMFPNIVNKARTIEVLSTGTLGGSVHLMYEEVHVLSPLVVPLEFFFIRYCKQFDPTTWVMVDVSYDFTKVLQDAFPTSAWKFPSGCMIQDLSNGKSTVTWLEHFQVDDKSPTHHFYRDLVHSCQAYGAKRWITTLQRMSERLAFSMRLITTPKHERVIKTIEGQRNLMKLSHGMVKEFYKALSMSEKHDFPHKSDFENSGLHVSFRKSSAPGQLDSIVVSAACTIWLPLSKENLFEFLKDEESRHQWDVLLSSEIPVRVITHVPTGTHSGNCISILQPYYGTNETRLIMLQESSIDPLGAQLIYAPMDLGALAAVVNGEDAMKIPILPSGYIISDDGRAKNNLNRASSSSNASNSAGSLLTVAFQILGSQSTGQLNMESVATVRSLISTTIRNIRVALHLSD